MLLLLVLLSPPPPPPPPPPAPPALPLRTAAVSRGASSGAAGVGSARRPAWRRGERRTRTRARGASSGRRAAAARSTGGRGSSSSSSSSSSSNSSRNASQQPMQAGAQAVSRARRWQQHAVSPPAARTWSPTSAMGTKLRGASSTCARPLPPAEPLCAPTVPIARARRSGDSHTKRQQHHRRDCSWADSAERCTPEASTMPPPLARFA